MVRLSNFVDWLERRDQTQNIWDDANQLYPNLNCADQNSGDRVLISIIQYPNSLKTNLTQNIPQPIIIILQQQTQISPHRHQPSAIALS